MTGHGRTVEVEPIENRVVVGLGFDVNTIDAMKRSYLTRLAKRIGIETNRNISSDTIREKMREYHNNNAKAMEVIKSSKNFKCTVDGCLQSYSKKCVLEFHLRPHIGPVDCKECGTNLTSYIMFKNHSCSN